MIKGLSMVNKEIPPLYVKPQNRSCFKMDEGESDSCLSTFFIFNPKRYITHLTLL